MVESLGPMVDLKKTPREKEEDYLPKVSEGPDYPYGLCIHLCHDELEKLGVDCNDFEVGGTVHFHAFGVVTSKSTSASVTSEPCDRI